MSPTPQIRALVPDDAQALIALRAEALRSAPLAFAASPGDDQGFSPDAVRASLSGRDPSAVFGAFDATALVGMVGVVQLNRRKAHHNALIWGMYVSAKARRSGAGAALLAAAIDRVRTWPGVIQIHLAVSDAAPEALRLYERAGFREWGAEPRALQWEGRFVAEHHMVLDLEAALTSPPERNTIP